MHDIANPFTASATRQFLEEKNTRILNWPAQPPDLNLIDYAEDIV